MYWESVRRSDDPSIFDYHLMPPACVGPPERQHLMGGVGLGAGIYALEQVSGSPILWASAQFVGASLVGADTTIQTEILHNGRRAVHGRATILENGRPIHIITGSLGKLEREETRTYFSMPDARPPESCKERNEFDLVPGNLISLIDIRIASVDLDKGYSLMWIRSRDRLPMSAAWLAVVADFMPAPHPESNKCTSLDNVLRVHKLVESEWVLGECQLSEYRNGYFHGDINMFAQDGTLLATGNQTALKF